MNLTQGRSQKEVSKAVDQVDIHQIALSSRWMQMPMQCWTVTTTSFQQIVKKIHENSLLIGILIFLVSFLVGITFYYFMNDWDIYLSYYYASTVLLGTLYLVPVDTNPYSQVFTLVYFLWGMVLMASALAVSAQTILDRVVKIASDERKRILEQARLMQERQRQKELERKERHRRRRAARRRNQRRRQEQQRQRERELLENQNDENKRINEEGDVFEGPQQQPQQQKHQRQSSLRIKTGRSYDDEDDHKEVENNRCCLFCSSWLLSWIALPIGVASTTRPKSSDYIQLKESAGVEMSLLHHQRSSTNLHSSPKDHSHLHHHNAHRSQSLMHLDHHQSQANMYYQQDGDLEIGVPNEHTNIDGPTTLGTSDNADALSAASEPEGGDDDDNDDENNKICGMKRNACCCCWFGNLCGDLSLGEWIFYYLDQLLVTIGWEYHRSKYIALTLLLFWFSVGVMFGLCYEEWSFLHSFYFAASAITAAGVAPPVCDGESLDNCNLGPTRSLLIGSYLIIGVPLFGYCLTQFAEYILEQVVRAKELKLMMNPISKSEMNYVLKLKQGVIPDQQVDDFEDTMTSITATNSFSGKMTQSSTNNATRPRGLSRHSSLSTSLDNVAIGQRETFQQQHHHRQAQSQSQGGMVLEFSDFLVLELLRLKKITKGDLEYVKSVYDAIVTQTNLSSTSFTTDMTSAGMESAQQPHQGLHETMSMSGISLTSAASPTTPLVRQPRSRRNSIVFQTATYGALEPIVEESLDMDDGTVKSAATSTKVVATSREAGVSSESAPAPSSITRSRSQSLKAPKMSRSRSTSGGNIALAFDSESAKTITAAIDSSKSLPGMDIMDGEGGDESISGRFTVDDRTAVKNADSGIEKPLLVDKVLTTALSSMHPATSTNQLLPSEFSPPLHSNDNGFAENDEDYMSEGVDLEATEEPYPSETPSEYPSVRSTPTVLADLRAEEKDGLALEYNRLLLPAMQQLQMQSQQLNQSYPSTHSSVTNLADINETEHLLAIRRQPSAKSGYFRRSSRIDSNLPFNENDEDVTHSDEDYSGTDDDNEYQGHGSDDDGSYYNDEDASYMDESDASMEDSDVERGRKQNKANQGLPNTSSTLHLGSSQVGRSAMMNRSKGMEDVYS